MNLSEIFDAEPNLKTISNRARLQRPNSYRRRILAYENIKDEAAVAVFGASLALAGKRN